ncbi:hypothetical protein POPTR_001G233550v4 [Populus trichocarpa]|uniref:Secreted protein n=1 Tax=Populus trichocarpa TaxID=3694 RepID=A0A3N7EBM4_POPTR|nr:hypothetical protein BDE02_01G210000 [Populus trichocarpa]RQO85263.1 hypothetical protein POPTR_001G233550v4 [Populus trichocarpa]
MPGRNGTDAVCLLSTLACSSCICPFIPASSRDIQVSTEELSLTSKSSSTTTILLVSVSPCSCSSTASFSRFIIFIHHNFQVICN